MLYTAYCGFTTWWMACWDTVTTYAHDQAAHMDMLQRVVDCSKWVEDVHVDAENADEWECIANMNEKRCGLFSSSHDSWCGVFYLTAPTWLTLFQSFRVFNFGGKLLRCLGNLPSKILSKNSLPWHSAGRRAPSVISYPSVDPTYSVGNSTVAHPIGAAWSLV